MKAKVCRLIAVGSITALVGSPVLAAPVNKLTNGGFEDFTGAFPNIDALTTASTKDEWSAGANFQSVDSGSIVEPTQGPMPFPTGWGGDNFAEHSQEFTGGDTDVTDLIRQAIAGSKIVPNVPVNLSFKYINTEPGRQLEVFVYGIDGNQVWSQFAPWPCQFPQFAPPTSTCTQLYHALVPAAPDYSTNQGWKTFADSFTPTASHDAVAVGIAVGGHYGYARGVDDVVLTQNQPPDCSGAKPSVATLWPPNHQFVPIDILGVTDPDGDSVTIQVTSIYQDEPVHDPGSGNTSPDGQGVGTATAQVRAERAGGGDGRVYHINFTADDGNGGTCNGAVTVSVPKSQGANGAAVDEGPLYDSTAP